MDTLALCNKLMDEEDILADSLSGQLGYFNQLCRDDLNKLQKEVLLEAYKGCQKEMDSARAEIRKISKLLEN